ncbi:uncharacterized protein LOC123565026 [Mercenaria mercenaria]|uniref:uncharacterized protein LOC123565026 n=1 Tax=Mercenaria mercenaria TaxID=6596 RepID=UPI00234F00BA|nr:uncharacterized protein LOC123565026 [Mercenaria mercenaria]
MSVNKQEEINSLESRLKELSKEYSKKIRKLEKHNRAAGARAYVQQRLKEEAENTGTAVRRLKSSCRKPADKSVRRHKSSDLKDRRRSTGSLKSEAVSVRHHTFSSLKPADLQSRHQTFSSLKHEDTSLRNHTASSFKDKLKHLNEANDIKNKDNSITAIRTSSFPKIETDSEHSVSQVLNSKLRKPIQDEITSKPVEAEEDIANVMTCEQKYTDSADSQDIFMSPPKHADSFKYADINTDNDTDADQVIIVPGHAEQVRNSEVLRLKNSLSKLKLSKYKRKNFVNPVKKEDLNIKQKFKRLSVKKEDVKIHASESVSTEPSDDSAVFHGSKITAGGMENRISRNTGVISSEIQDDSQNTAQGTVYSEGQVIVFERQLSNEDKENKDFKSKTAKRSQKSKGNIAVDRKSLEKFTEAASAISTTLSSTESSVSTVCDNDSVEHYEDSTKIRRRSGSRKRRSSGFEAQRRSSRIAGQPSQDSQSQSTESEVISPSFVTTGEAAAKKRVIISSVFQCLVDEGRRKSDIEEFSVPADVLESQLKPDNVSKLDDYDQTFDVPVTKTHHIHSGSKDLMAIEKEKTFKSEFSKEIQTDLSELSKVVTDNYVSNSEKEEVISPTLFDSQSYDSTFRFSKEEVINEVEYPHGKRENGLKSKGDNCLTDCDVVQQSDTDQGVDIDPGTKVKEPCLHLQQIGSFQVPKCDYVHSVMCVETVCNDQIQPYVLCLCSSCLKLYTVCNNQWTCVANTKLGFITRKKSGNLMYSLPDCDTVSVVLLGMKSDCICIYVYTYFQQKWIQSVLDKVFSKSIQVCPLSKNHVVISYYTDERTYLSKYSLDTGSGQWSSVQLDSSDKQITHLVRVRGIDAAVLTITKTAEVQIWNHEHGYLLSTVDVSDVCPPDPICTLAFAEQGFLLVPLLTRKKSIEAGTVVVINPCMSTSETLTSITVHDNWTGCINYCVMSHGLLLCRQNNGCIRLWNVYTGCLLATVNDVIVTCFSATNQHLVAAHKQCVHMYKLNIPSLSY